MEGAAGGGAGGGGGVRRALIAVALTAAFGLGLVLLTLTTSKSKGRSNRSTSRDTSNERTKPSKEPERQEESPEITAEAKTSDSNEGESHKTDEIAALKKQFDDFHRLASKCSGSNYARAAEYYSKCIDICDRVPAYGGSLLGLYNNRSAMYEKMDDLERCEADLAVLLALSHTHTKGRLRKARILEKQGLVRESLTELCFVAVEHKRKTLNSGKEEESPIDIGMLDGLLKKIVHEDLEALLPVMQAVRGLPATAVVREYFKSYHDLKAFGRPFVGISRTLLSVDLEESKTAADSDPYRVAAALLALIKFDTFKQSYPSALELVLEAEVVVRANIQQWTEPQVSDNLTAGQVDVLAQLMDLVGTYLHLYNSIERAEFMFQEALKLYESLEASESTRHKTAMMCVKLAGIVLETYPNRRVAEAEALCDRAVQLDATNATIYVSRSAMFQLLKQEERSTAEIMKALEVDPLNVQAVARVLPLKMAEGKFQEAMDLMEQLKAAHPADVTVMSLSLEYLAMNGEFAEIRRVVKSASEIEPDNPMPFISHASVCMQLLQLGAMGPIPGAGTSPDEIHDLLDRALEADPCNTLALSLKGQLAINLSTKSSDALMAIHLFERAIGCSRDVDELEELLRFKAMAVAQHEATSML